MVLRKYSAIQITVTALIAIFLTMEQVVCATEWQPRIGVRGTIPQKASVYIGLGPQSLGPEFIIEPGLSGGKIQVGYGSRTHMGGHSIRLSLLQTWNAPVLAKNDQTYIGLEYEIIAILVTFHVGGYFSVERENPDEAIFSTGVGFGF